MRQIRSAANFLSTILFCYHFWFYLYRCSRTLVGLETPDQHSSARYLKFILRQHLIIFACFWFPYHFIINIWMIQKYGKFLLAQIKNFLYIYFLDIRWLYRLYQMSIFSYSCPIASHRAAIATADMVCIDTPLILNLRSCYAIIVSMRLWIHHLDSVREIGLILMLLCVAHYCLLFQWQQWICHKSLLTMKNKDKYKERGSRGLTRFSVSFSFEWLHSY
jgi:hypothetical protein